MIKKVVVAAAGRGTRMLDLSKDKPKHLIEVNGHPFLYYLLSNLKEAGFEEIIMVIGYKKEIMEEFLNRYKNEFNITHIINQFDMLGEKYGTLCPVECVKDIISPDESFMVVMGDNLYSVPDLKKLRIDDEFCYVAGLQHPEPQRYGVLVRDGDDFLENILEKPENPPSNLINTALYKFTPAVFKKIPLIEKSVRGEYEITDAINLLAQEKRVKIKEIEDHWLDFGKPDDVRIIGEFLNQDEKSV